MTGKSHYRVRGVNCGKCNRIHTWYKYRVWRDGDKIKEEYVGKCDRDGNMADEDFKHYSDRWWQKEQQKRQQQEMPPSRHPRTPYEILGVSYYATREQIIKAYHNLVKQYHPDVNKHADHRTIAEINVAYQTLMRS